MINFFTPINFSGYGICSYHLLKAYYKNYNKDILLLPISEHIQIEDNIINLLINNRKLFVKTNPSIMICEDKYMPHFIGIPRIGFPIFENDFFSSESIAGLNSLDHIIVTSKWAKKVLNKNGYENISIVNLGFDPKIFFAKQSFDEKIKTIEKEIIFVTLGKFEQRKNSLLILSSFIKTFSSFHKKVILYSHMYNANYSNWKKDIHSFLTEFGAIFENGFYVKNNLKIKFFNEIFLSFNEINDLYNKAHFGVFLSNAEGWNLPLIECLAAGTPCLCSNIPSHAEFIENLNSDFKINPKENISDINFQLKESQFLFSETEIKEKLLDMAENVSNYYEKFNPYYNFLKDTFTWKHSAEQLHNIPLIRRIINNF